MISTNRCSASASRKIVAGIWKAASTSTTVTWISRPSGRDLPTRWFAPRIPRPTRQSWRSLLLRRHGDHPIPLADHAVPLRDDQLLPGQAAANLHTYAV